MDAVPVTLGQEFGGYAAQVRQGIARIEATLPTARPDPARRHGRRHRPEHASGVRREGARAALRRHRPRRSPRRPTRSRRRPRATALVEAVGRAEDARGLADQDRERPPLHGLGPARRSRRDLPAGAPEGQLDHARQGEPGHPGGRDAGRGAGDRQRRGDRGRRPAGPFRAERLRPADGAEPARLDQAARERLAPAGREVRRRHRGEPRAVRALRRADALGRDRAQPVHRLRQGARDREGGRRRPGARCARSRATRASRRRSSTRRSTTARWPSRTTPERTA